MSNRWERRASNRGRALLFASMFGAGLLMMPVEFFPRLGVAAGIPRPLGPGPGTVETLDMVNPSSGWGWGPTVVVRALNGARRLVNVTPSGVDGSHPVIGETALDTRHAWIVSGREGGGAEFTVYATRDGGVSWSAARVGRGLFGGITFVDARHGWLETSRVVAGHAVTVVTLSRTRDGGRSWSTVYRSGQRIAVQPEAQHGNCAWSAPRFSTVFHGVIGLSCRGTSRPQIDLTDDGGKSWQRSVLPPLRHPPGTVLFNTVERPFIVARAGAALVVDCVGDQHSCREYGSLYHSADGGRTWTAGRTLVLAGGEPVFADADRVWLPYGCVKVCGATPRLLRTRDGGTHWQSLSLPTALLPNMHGSRQFQFVSPTMGFAVSGQEFDPAIHFFRTTDGGRSFHPFEPRVVHG